MSDHTALLHTHRKSDATVVHEREPFNAEPAPAQLAGSDLTPLEAFYSRNHGAVPDLDPDRWRLVVGDLELSLADLRERFEEHTVTATMQCAGNRRADLVDVAEIPGEDPWRHAIGTATWTGCRLGDVLRACGLAEAGAHVAFDAPDVSDTPTPPAAYGSSIPLAKALAPETLLAWGMNGEALPALHGGPVRVVAPGYVGARSVKWVHRISVQPEPSDNYFQATAYRVLPPDFADPETAGPGDGISLGPWALNAEVLRPADGTQVAAGTLVVEGYAVAAEHRSVALVEVCVDDGPWVAAELLADLGPWAWRRWRAEVTVTAGRRTVRARAWDDTGAQQPRDPADLWNPKGYANTAWARVGLDVR